MSNVQNTQSFTEGGTVLDPEEAILAKWEDAENQPSEDEAEATQDDPEETTDDTCLLYTSPSPRD